MQHHMQIKTLTDMSVLANRVRKIRSETNMNQAEFARAVGLTRSAINQLEAGGTKRLSGESLAKISRWSGYAAEWLAHGTGLEKITNGDASTVLDPNWPEQLSRAELIQVIGRCSDQLSRQEHEKQLQGLAHGRR